MNTETMSPAEVQETLDRSARYLYDILQARADEPTASRDDVLVAEAALRHWQSLAAVAALIAREATLIAERDALIARHAASERDACSQAERANESVALAHKFIDAIANEIRAAGCVFLTDTAEVRNLRAENAEAERDALAERVKALEAAMHDIERRCFSHPNDDDADRKRNLYIAHSIATRFVSSEEARDV